MVQVEVEVADQDEVDKPHTKLTFLDRRELVKRLIRARIPVLLSGPPGVAKTESLEQIAKELEAGFVPLAIATRPAEDFSGIAIPETMLNLVVKAAVESFGDGVLPTDWLRATVTRLRSASGSLMGVRQEPLSWLVRALHAAETHPGGCLVLFDEFGCGKPSTQAAMLSLVQSRYCGDTSIPRSISFVAATNPVSQAAGGWEFPLPTRSRWTWMSWPGPSAQEWVSWLLSAKSSSRSWSTKFGVEARSRIAGFLQVMPSKLVHIPDVVYGAESAESVDSMAYPCPRSWYNGAVIYAELLAAELPETFVVEALAGTIGMGVTREFIQWVKQADLPDPEDVLLNPDAWDLDTTRADKTLATLLGVVGAIIVRPNSKRYKAGVHAIVRAASAGQAGVAVVAVRHLVSDPEVGHLPPPIELGVLSQILGVKSF